MREMQARGAATLAVCCLALAACGVAPNEAAFIASPSPAASPQPTPSPAQPAFSPAPPLPSPSQVASGSCQIPIADISEAKGWFITVPGGNRQDDPASVVALPGGTPGQIGINPGLTFDKAAGLWVPVPYQWLAPGGSVYAYQDFSSRAIRAVNVIDGSSGQVVPGGSWILMTTADDGVYVTRSDGPGAWFISFDGQARQVIDHGSWQRLFEGSMWGVDPSGALVRHNLITGSETPLSPVPASAWILGFDVSGDPLLSSGGALMLVRADHSVATLWAGTNGSVGGRAVGDELGVWFEVGGGLFGAPGHGLYLWTAAAGAQIVSNSEGNLAGGCS